MSTARLVRRSIGAGKRAREPMIRLHMDDLQHMLPHAYFAYLKRLEQNDAIVVWPDDSTVPMNSGSDSFEP